MSSSEMKQSQSQTHKHKSKTKTIRKNELKEENLRVITPLKIMEPDTTEYVAVKAEDYLFANDFIYGGTSSKGFGNDATMENLSISFEKKPWSRLEMTIRLKKLNEWIDEKREEWIKLHPEKEETTLSVFFENLRRELIEKVRSGELTKQKMILYDTDLRKITNIPSLHIEYDTTEMTFKYSFDNKRKS
jgi:hypothetical protein